VQIIKNAARCLNCNEVVESMHRHDFVQCSCGNVAVDGGKAYLKRSVGKMESKICQSWVMIKIAIGTKIGYNVAAERFNGHFKLLSPR